MVWTGRVLSGLFVLFMLGASIAPKLIPGADVDEAAMAEVGWPVKYLVLIGVIELVCVVLYVIPRTAVLGCVLMTALLGGAIATHLRVDDPLFSHTLFGVYLGLIMWCGVWLRNEPLRSVFPLQRAM